MTFKIDPKTIELDLNERLKLMGAIEVSIKHHRKCCRNSNPEGRSYQDRARTIAYLEDLATKIQKAGE